MRRTARLPDDAKLVMPGRTGHALREHGPTTVIFAGTTVLAALGVGATGSPVWLVVGLLCLAGVLLELLLIRAQAGSGPLLAADGEHVWVRAGGFLSPRSVQLAWPEITTVTLHLWRGRRSATARYLSFDVTDEVMAELATDPLLARRARRLSRVFGSPLAVTEPKARVLDEVVRELRDLAPDDVLFAHRT